MSKDHFFLIYINENQQRRKILLFEKRGTRGTLFISDEKVVKAREMELKVQR